MWFDEFMHVLCSNDLTCSPHFEGNTFSKPWFAVSIDVNFQGIMWCRDHLRTWSADGGSYYKWRHPSDGSWCHDFGCSLTQQQPVSEKMLLSLCAKNWAFPKWIKVDLIDITYDHQKGSTFSPAWKGTLLRKFPISPFHTFGVFIFKELTTWEGYFSCFSSRDRFAFPGNPTNSKVNHTGSAKTWLLETGKVISYSILLVNEHSYPGT